MGAQELFLAYLRDTDRAYVLTGNRYEPAAAGAEQCVNAQQELIDWYASRPSSPDSGD